MGSIKTTIYLPVELKAGVEREAKRRGTSEAEVIRAAISSAVGRPRPIPGIFRAPISASDVDELLEGFGED
jgi:hypothetical protein